MQPGVPSRSCPTAAAEAPIARDPRDRPGIPSSISPEGLEFLGAAGISHREPGLVDAVPTGAPRSAFWKGLGLGLLCARLRRGPAVGAPRARPRTPEARPHRT